MEMMSGEPGSNKAGKLTERERERQRGGGFHCCFCFFPDYISHAAVFLLGQLGKVARSDKANQTAN